MRNAFRLMWPYMLMCLGLFMVSIWLISYRLTTNYTVVRPAAVHACRADTATGSVTWTSDGPCVLPVVSAP